MNRTTFSVALLLSAVYPPLHAFKESVPIRLEARIISSIDGLPLGIDANTMDIINAFRRGIVKILQTKVPYNDEQTAITNLMKYEQELERKRESMPQEVYNKLKEQLRQALLKAKQLFLQLSNQFKAVVQDVKPIMSSLIKESCTKRNRGRSLLVVWSETKKENEDALFDQHVTRIEDFDTFCNDLYNFLGDLMHSCPKAFAQYEENKKKLNRIQSAIDELNLISDQAKYRNFLLYIKKNHLDKLKLDTITQDKVKQLYNGFGK